MTNVLFIPGTYCNYGHFFFVTCFCYLWKRPIFRLELKRFFLGEMNSITFARTCKQNNAYVPLIFANYLNVALVAEVEPFAIVVRLPTTHSVKIRSEHQFSFKFHASERFFSLELLATLLKADSDSYDVVVRAPLPEPVSYTNTKWKYKTEEKQHEILL